jgi:MoCo/4Fe-4S cofactor protein with predicted Tat translocation signal
MTQHKTEAQVNGEQITYWRSIDNRRRTEEYMNYLHDEFAPDISEITSMDRRSMLKFMGASVALAGVGVSCRRPQHEILPYATQPAGFVPGKPHFFATAQPTPFGVNPILVESHEGRPTKVEGNPEHPESMGKASYINQASVLELYDPDRSRFCSQEKAGDRLPVEWSEWDKFAQTHFAELKAKAGQGFVVVTDCDLSPTFLRLKGLIKQQFPKVEFMVHEPMRPINQEQAAALAFGPFTKVRYNLDKAQTVVSLFADPLAFGPDHIRQQRGFSKARAVATPADAQKMNRLYAVEANLSLTGTNADNRLRLPVGLAKTFVLGLAYELLANNNLDVDVTRYPGAKSLTQIVARPPSLKGVDKKFVKVVAKDLAENRGRSVIIGGNHLSPEILAMIHVLNDVLKGRGQVFDVLSMDDKDIQQHLSEPSISELGKKLESGAVDTLVFLGVNPVYNAPKRANLAALIKKARVSIHVGLVQDETGHACLWHVPQTHFMEHFADGRSFDGTITIIQPLISPLHNARSTLEIMAQMMGKKATSKDLVWETCQAMLGVDFEKPLKKIIHEGLWAGTGYAVNTAPKLLTDSIFTKFNEATTRAPNRDNVELVFEFDRSVLDGRYANHSWLQEMPDPVNKIAWDNALFMSPTLAKEMGIKSGVRKNAYMGDVVKFSVQNVEKLLPVFVMPGLNDYSVIVPFGYGRTQAGKIGNGVGVDVFDLWNDGGTFVVPGVKLERTLESRSIATTQEQFAMNGDTVQAVDALSLQGRDPGRLADMRDFSKDPKYAKKGLPENLLTHEAGKNEKQPLQITKAWDYTKGNQWGMAIDLSKCTGCNACVVACQSENNVPVVGRKQVIVGRSMHWLRLDRYYTGDIKAPRSLAQPVMCQHCENAPCEPVCPVAATVHDPEGLNVMVYNRCVGTRYCANNCPFKVRRFNYFDFSNSGDLYVAEEARERQKTLKLQRNPEVTVRYRGTMEKCNSCSQRVQEAKLLAVTNGQDKDNLPDGAVTPACAQTCPSEAIVFGNINDPNSRVAMWKKMDRNYTMLDVLNVRPRASYLSKVMNPHPELES